MARSTRVFRVIPSSAATILAILTTSLSSITVVVDLSMGLWYHGNMTTATIKAQKAKRQLAKVEDIETILSDLNSNHLAFIRKERGYDSYMRLMRVLCTQLRDACDPA